MSKLNWVTKACGMFSIVASGGSGLACADIHHAVQLRLY